MKTEVVTVMERIGLANGYVNDAMGELAAASDTLLTAPDQEPNKLNSIQEQLSEISKVLYELTISVYREE